MTDRIARITLLSPLGDQAIELIVYPLVTYKRILMRCQGAWIQEHQYTLSGDTDAQREQSNYERAGWVRGKLA